MFSSFALLGLRVVFLSTCIILTLVANGKGRASSLWLRTWALIVLTLLPTSGALDLPLIFGDNVFILPQTIPSALLIGAVAIQAARAIHTSPRVEIGFGITAASVVCWGGLAPLYIV